MVPWCSGKHACLSRRRARVQISSEPPKRNYSLGVSMQTDLEKRISSVLTSGQLLLARLILASTLPFIGIMWVGLKVYGAKKNLIGM